MTLLRLLTRRASGEFTVTSPEGKIERGGQTLTCVHCGRMWEVEPGSGQRRGWCFRCNGATCGSKECQRCLPFERQLEIMERREALRRKANEWK